MGSNEAEKVWPMRRAWPFAMLGFAGLLLFSSGGAPAGQHKQRCEAWNNWCRPLCGSWNANCAGQSTATIINRMAPQSFFANPWYHGQRLKGDDWWDRGPGLRKTAPQ
jgi:hypothetical protein